MSDTLNDDFDKDSSSLDTDKEDDDGDVLENRQNTINIFNSDNAKVGKAVIQTSSKLNNSLNNL